MPRLYTGPFPPRGRRITLPAVAPYIAGDILVLEENPPSYWVVVFTHTDLPNLTATDTTTLELIPARWYHHVQAWVFAKWSRAKLLVTLRWHYLAWWRDRGRERYR